MEQSQEEMEFWYFPGAVPLPPLEETARIMIGTCPHFTMKSKGTIELLKDNLAFGEIAAGDEDAESIETAWLVEWIDPKRFFKHARQMINLAGNNPMLRVVVDDDYSLGNALNMLRALLTACGGTLAVPQPGGNAVVLDREDAIAMIDEELDELVREIVIADIEE